MRVILPLSRANLRANWKHSEAPPINLPGKVTNASSGTIVGNPEVTILLVLTSGWPVIRPQSRIDPTEACQSIRFLFFASYLLALITYIK